MVNSEHYKKLKLPGNEDKLKEHQQKCSERAKRNRSGPDSANIKRREANNAKKSRLKKKQSKAIANAEFLGDFAKPDHETATADFEQYTEDELLEPDHEVFEIAEPEISNLRSGLTFDPREEIGKKVNFKNFEKIKNFKLAIQKASEDWNNNYNFRILNNELELGCTVRGCGHIIKYSISTLDLYSHFMRTHLRVCTGCGCENVSLRHFDEPSKHFCKYMVQTINPKKEFMKEFINKHFYIR